jgi:acetyl esterase/lipase
VDKRSGDWDFMPHVEQTRRATVQADVAAAVHRLRSPEGGDDPSIPPEDVAGLEAALSAAGVEHDVVTYEGAPHSFFDRKQEEFAEASEDAWTRTLAFIAQHGGADPR